MAKPLNVRKGTQGFIETTRTTPAPSYLGESAIGDPEADPFSEKAMLVVSIEDDDTDEENGYRTVKTFETNTVFAQHARKMLGVEDDSLPVEITETYSEYGDSTIESYTDVEVRCGGKAFEMDSQRTLDPMASMLRAVEHHDKEKPQVTVMRLLGRDPNGDNLPSQPVTFHRLDGRKVVGTVESFGGSTVYLAEKRPDGTAQQVRFYDITHIETADYDGLRAHAKALSTSPTFRNFRTPEGATDMCDYAVTEARVELGGVVVRLNGRLSDPPRRPNGIDRLAMEHYVNVVDGMVVDFTARQYDPKAPFPMVMRVEDYRADWSLVEEVED